MLGFLAGLPGQIASVITHLTTHLSSTRCAKIDNADVATSTRAPASTALSTVVWTNNHANAIANAAQENTPILDVPIASGFQAAAGQYAQAAYLYQLGGLIEQANTGGSWVDLVNITNAQGVLDCLAHTFSLSSANAQAVIEVIIDGVTVLSWTTPGAYGAGTVFCCPIIGVGVVLDANGYWRPYAIGGGGIPFKSSLQIRHHAHTDGTSSSRVLWRYHRTK